VPEGDTIHYAANRIRPVLEGHVPDEIRTPHRRFARDRWPEKLQGHAVKSVDAHGKHLFIRFAHGLTIHGHLRMTGSWRVVPVDAPKWPRSPHRAWLVIRRDDMQVVQFDGPVLELMTDSRTRFDRQLAGLGPDILAPGEFNHERYLRRLREDDPTRPIGDALLDQSIVAGLGTVWRAEACWRGEVDPFKPTREVSDERALAMMEIIRPFMQKSARDGFQDRHKQVYGRAGQPCPRCKAPFLIKGTTMGDDNRPLFWCPNCQRAARP
jgi:endonuclease-8